MFMGFLTRQAFKITASRKLWENYSNRCGGSLRTINVLLLLLRLIGGTLWDLRLVATLRRVIRRQKGESMTSLNYKKHADDDSLLFDVTQQRLAQVESLAERSLKAML